MVRILHDKRNIMGDQILFRLFHIKCIILRPKILLRVHVNRAEEKIIRPRPPACNCRPIIHTAGYSFPKPCRCSIRTVGCSAQPRQLVHSQLTRSPEYINSLSANTRCQSQLIRCVENLSSCHPKLAVKQPRRPARPRREL